MSHNIQENDKIVALESTWHGLETIVPEITFENSGLNWQVDTRKAYFNGANGGFVEIPGKVNLVRADNELHLSTFTDSYGVIQNSRLWEVLQNGLSKIDYVIESAGSLGNCKRVFVSVNIKGGKDKLTNGDAFKEHVLFCNSFDGFSKFRALESLIRAICQNTLTWSLNSAGANTYVNLSVKHTKNSELQIEKIEFDLDKLFEMQEQKIQAVERLGNTPVDLSKAMNIVLAFETPAKNNVPSSQVVNRTGRILELFQGGRGNGGKNLWDLTNGFTEYYTHEFTKKENRLAGGFIGTQADRKAAFFNALLDENKVEKLVNRGRELAKAS